MHNCRINASVTEVAEGYSLTDDPELGIIQHDLLLAIILKFNRSDRVVFRTFHTDDFAEAELLMFDFLTHLKSRSVTGHEIRTWIMLDGLHIRFGGNIGRLGVFFGPRRRSIFSFCLGGAAIPAAMHPVVGGAGRPCETLALVANTTTGKAPVHV